MLNNWLNCKQLQNSVTASHVLSVNTASCVQIILQHVSCDMVSAAASCIDQPAYIASVAVAWYLPT